VERRAGRRGGGTPPELPCPTALKPPAVEAEEVKPLLVGAWERFSYKDLRVSFSAAVPVVATGWLIVVPSVVAGAVVPKIEEPSLVPLKGGWTTRGRSSEVVERVAVRVGRVVEVITAGARACNKGPSCLGEDTGTVAAAVVVVVVKPLASVEPAPPPAPRAGEVRSQGVLAGEGLVEAAADSNPELPDVVFLLEEFRDCQYSATSLG